MPSIWPDRQFYSDVGGTLKRGLLDPDFYKGFAKEATVGLLGAPGDVGYLLGGVLPAAVHNWREGLPLSQDMGRPEDYAFTSESLADTFGVPFTGSGPENAGRVLGGVLDVGNMAGFLRHTARGLPDGVINTGPMGKQQGAIGSTKAAERMAAAGNPVPMENLRKAEMMQMSGKRPDEIWQATAPSGYGVYYDNANNPIFETMDTNPGLSNRFAQMGVGDIPDEPMRLADALISPEYAEMYPDEMANTLVRWSDDMVGANRGEYADGMINIQRGVDDPLGVLRHETVHGVVQRGEGLPRGGNARDPELYNLARRQITTKMDDALNRMDAFPEDSPDYLSARSEWNMLSDKINEIDANETYLRLAGEEQARADPSRLFMTAEERAATPYYRSMDTPMDEQIVRYGGDGPAEMTVYHGSPHKFDRFDMSKIGTGEGAQAYGHGLYFAESKAISGPEGTYTKAFQRNLDAGFDRPSYSIFENGDGTYGIDKTQQTLSTSKGMGGEYLNIGDTLGDYPSLEAAKAAAVKDSGLSLDDFNFAEGVEGVPQAGGKLTPKAYSYTVDIPDESIAKMLDWDAPLSEQPESVRKAIDAALSNQPSGARSAKELSRDITGGEFYQMIGYGDGERASKSLESVGIPGIKYYDGGSRGAGEGTRNLVVFDDKLPRILSRNGQPLELPMDEASRMQRAREMGFDVDDPIYRGLRPQTESGQAGPSGNQWWTHDPEYASAYATNGEVRPAYVNKGDVIDTRTPEGEKLFKQFLEDRDYEPGYAPFLQNTGLPSYLDEYRFRDWLNEKGIPAKGVYFDEGNGMVSLNVSDSSAVRGKFAKFDPAKKDSANILAGMGGLGLLGAAGLYQPDSGKPPGS